MKMPPVWPRPASVQTFSSKRWSEGWCSTPVTVSGIPETRIVCCGEQLARDNGRTLFIQTASDMVRIPPKFYAEELSCSVT